MEQYISQLLEDMLAAHRTDDEVKIQKIDEDSEDLFAEVERYLSGEGERPFGEIIGFYAEQFPPAERLNKYQMKQIAEAYEKLLGSYNIYADMPEKLPISIKYKLLIGTLEREVFIGNEGFVGIEFCNYNIESCPFGEKYCSCKEFEKDYENDLKNKGNAKMDDSDFPF